MCVCVRVCACAAAQELERLVCGNPTLDWGALQRNAKYEGGYTANSPVVVWLWDIVSAPTHPRTLHLDAASS